MAEIVAIGSLIGAKIAAAGSAAAGAAASVGLGTTATVGTGAVATTAGSGLAGALGSASAFVASNAALVGTGVLAAGGLAFGGASGVFGGGGPGASAAGDLQIQSERTQAAVEAENRQRQLQQILASQNAYFGASNIAIGSGTFDAIASDSMDNASRQQRQANTFSSVRQGMIGLQVNDRLSASANGRRRAVLGGARSLVGAGLQLAAIGSVPRGNVLNGGNAVTATP